MVDLTQVLPPVLMGILAGSCITLGYLYRRDLVQLRKLKEEHEQLINFTEQLLQLGVGNSSSRMLGARKRSTSNPRTNQGRRY